MALVPGRLFRRLRLIWVPEAQFQALPRPDSAPPVPGMENPKRLILLGGGPIVYLIDDEGDGHVRPIDLYKRSL
jgi:hypothetical protein